GRAATELVSDHRVAGEVDRHHVEARLRQRTRPDLMKADSELRLVDMNTKIAVVDVVVFFEQELLRLQRRLKFQIVHVRAHVRLVWPLSFFSAHERVDVMTAVSADDEGHVQVLARELDDTRIALVVVGMRRPKRMRMDAFPLAYLINVPKHRRAARVVAATAHIRWGRIAEWRMVGREQNRARVFLLLNPLELRCEKIQLKVGNTGPVTSLAGDEAGVFQRVAEQPDDAHVWRIEGEIDARLGHGGAMQRAGLGRDDGSVGAEVAVEYLQRLLSRSGARDDEGVVIARNGEDRS